MLGLPQRARRLRGARARLARGDLERVRELRPAQQAGRAQPRQQILGAAVEQRAAQQPDEPPPERRVAEGDPAVDRDRHAERAEDLHDEGGDRRGVAQHDGDLLRGVALLADEAGDLRCDELELRALAAALQQRDRIPGVDRVGLEQPAVRRQLEELALELVQRRPRGGGVVLRARAQRDVLVGTQLLKRRGAPAERHAPGLVGERERDLRAGPGERLDGVALQGGEVVEAVDVDGRGAPRRGALAHRVERRGRMQRLVAAAEALELAPVGGVQAGDLVGVRAPPLVAGGPRAQRLREALRRDALLLELVDEPQQGACEAARPRRAGERAQRRRRDGGSRHALAGERPQRPPSHPAAPRDLVEQPAEAHDLRAEDDPARGELRPIALDVGERRHDEDRRLVAAQRRAVAVEHDASLLGVGGTGDELEGHASYGGACTRRLDDAPWAVSAAG